MLRAPTNTPATSTRSGPARPGPARPADAPNQASAYPAQGTRAATAARAPQLQRTPQSAGLGSAWLRRGPGAVGNRLSQGGAVRAQGDAAPSPGAGPSKGPAVARAGVRAGRHQDSKPQGRARPAGDGAPAARAARVEGRAAGCTRGAKAASSPLCAQRSAQSIAPAAPLHPPLGASVSLVSLGSAGGGRRAARPGARTGGSPPPPASLAPPPHLSRRCACGGGGRPATPRLQAARGAVEVEVGCGWNVGVRGGGGAGTAFAPKQADGPDRAADRRAPRRQENPAVRRPQTARRAGGRGGPALRRA
jgi:hypothetical protein